MPVIRGGDEHRVNILAVKDATEILVGLAFANPFLSGGYALKIHIAHGGNGAAWIVVYAQQTLALSSTANEGGHHPVTGRLTVGCLGRAVKK
jgi:hypothetical protein